MVMHSKMVTLEKKILDINGREQCGSNFAEGGSCED